MKANDDTPTDGSTPKHLDVSKILRRPPMIKIDSLCVSPAPLSPVNLMDISRVLAET